MVNMKCFQNIEYLEWLSWLHMVYISTYMYIAWSTVIKTKYQAKFLVFPELIHMIAVIIF